MSVPGFIRKMVVVALLVLPSALLAQAISKEEFERYKIEAAEGDAEATYHLGPYGGFYCDNRNIRNIDVEREVVFRDALRAVW